jgi:cholesterol transport system auxiliary component
MKAIVMVTCVISLTVALVGCFGPIKTPEQKTYFLTDQGAGVAAPGRPLPATLLVTVPAADPGYNTDGMAYIKVPYRLQYYAQNRWVDSPARLLVPLMVEALSDTQHFAHVVAPPYTSAMSYRLDTHLIELVQDFTHKPSVVHLQVSAQLIRTSTQQVIASQLFVVTRSAPSENPYGQVRAANQAVTEFLRQLSHFVIDNTSRP